MTILKSPNSTPRSKASYKGAVAISTYFVTVISLSEGGAGRGLCPVLSAASNPYCNSDKEIVMDIFMVGNEVWCEEEGRCRRYLHGDFRKLVEIIKVDKGWGLAWDYHWK